VGIVIWCIRNARLAQGDGLFDLRIEGERLVEILPAADRLDASDLNANGAWVLPGLIDPHVHFNEPGRTEWEGLESGSEALAAGGGTVFFDMPLNSNPPVTKLAAFEEKRRIAEVKSVTDFGLWAGIVPGNTDELRRLHDAGAVSFKAFLCDSGIAEFPASDPATMRAAMRVAASCGAMVGVHAESPSALGVTHGEDWRAFAEARPVEAECAAVRNLVEWAGESGCRLHIVHVSAPEVLDLIAAARKVGVNITGEVCAHHAFLDETAMEKIGVLAKCAPPLRDAKRVADIWDRWQEVCCVASDHSPAPVEMKREMPFVKAWGGIAGVQHTLPLFAGRWFAEGRSMDELQRLIAGGAAQRWQLQDRGRIKVGAFADFAIVARDDTASIALEDLRDRNRASPYVGVRPGARVTHTLRRGLLIMEHGKICVEGGGQFVRPVLC